jgi:hypothetical protein
MTACLQRARSPPLIFGTATKDWVITLNDVSDAGWHDIVVKGSSPLGDIAFY